MVDEAPFNHYFKPYTPMKKHRGQMEHEYKQIVWKGQQ